MVAAGQFTRMLSGHGAHAGAQGAQASVQQAAQHVGGASGSLLTDSILVLEELVEEFRAVEKFCSLREERKDSYLGAYKKHQKSLDQTETAIALCMLQRKKDTHE